MFNRHTRNNMKIALKSLHHKPSRCLIELLEKELLALSTKLQIDEARVVFKRRLGGSPPFYVSFHLVTPGPDVEAATTGHALRAALLKAFDALRSRIDRRPQIHARRKDDDLVPAGHCRRANTDPRR